MKTDPKVIVFTSPSCSWCKVVKDYLKEKKVKFKAIDISKDKKAAEDMVKRTKQQGVPVILIDNRPIIGFDKSKINRLLGIK